MKLYYAPYTCSLASHIVALEAGLTLDLVKVDIRRSPPITEAGTNYRKINSEGYVPALQLEDGFILTEGAVILQYMADLRPESRLAPPPGGRERIIFESWLTFIATELHKMYSPWLFHPEYAAEVQTVARGKIVQRLARVEFQLAAGRPYLLGEDFTAADAYLYTIADWSRLTGIDLSPFPTLEAYLATVGARPATQAARNAQGMGIAHGSGQSQP